MQEEEHWEKKKLLEFFFFFIIFYFFLLIWRIKKNNWTKKMKWNSIFKCLFNGEMFDSNILICSKEGNRNEKMRIFCFSLFSFYWEFTLVYIYIFFFFWCDNNNMGTQWQPMTTATTKTTAITKPSKQQNYASLVFWYA